MNGSSFSIALTLLNTLSKVKNVKLMFTLKLMISLIRQTKKEYYSLINLHVHVKT